MHLMLRQIKMRYWINKKQKSSHSKAQKTINRILNGRMGDWPEDVYIPKTS